MKPLYTQKEFDLTKSSEKLKLMCYQCNKTFYKKKNLIQLVLKKYVNKKGKDYSKSCRFCSDKCSRESKKMGKEVNCKECNAVFYKTKSEIKKYPNHFCCRSCAVTYNNKNKTHGTRRSKFEIWMEEQLTLLYPDIEIHFNRKDAIKSELDIYIPSLNLAVELNGIFHYEPIFGEDKLQQIQNNDQRKFQACIEEGIELALIDVSQLKYFKPKNAQKYLNIVTSIINSKLT